MFGLASTLVAELVAALTAACDFPPVFCQDLGAEGMAECRAGCSGGYDSWQLQDRLQVSVQRRRCAPQGWLLHWYFVRLVVRWPFRDLNSVQPVAQQATAPGQASP